jgi:hypothetical protein
MFPEPEEMHRFPRSLARQLRVPAVGREEWATHPAVSVRGRYREVPGKEGIQSMGYLFNMGRTASPIQDRVVAVVVVWGPVLLAPEIQVREDREL